jgi:hypothetical protein
MSIQRKSRAIAAAIVTTALLGTSGAHAQAKNPLNGRWIMADNSVLIIRGSEWFHPRYGAASIRKGNGAADIEVFYHRDRFARCGYRVHLAASGEILVLETTEQTQSMDFCPSGRFSRQD